MSWLDAPSRAIRAILASCGVRSSLVSSVRLRAVSPVASSSRLARCANASAPISAKLARARSELLARIDAAAASAQPFAVQQMRASEVEGDATAAEAVDRLAVEALGDRAVAQQRCAARLDAERPLGPGDLRSLAQALERVSRQLGLAAADGRLDQLG